MEQVVQTKLEQVIARLAEHASLEDTLMSALIDGVDYGKIPRATKPCLLKPGAEKIVQALGLRASFPGLSRYEEACQSGVAIGDILIRCYLSTEDGTVVAEGCGGRTAGQDAGRGGRDLNKAIKMAMKSAYIDAALRVSGLSSRLTQDIDEDTKDDKTDGSSRKGVDSAPRWTPPPTAFNEPPHYTPPPPPPPPEFEEDPIITSEMANSLNATIHESGVPLYKFVSWMKTKFGTDDMTKLKKSQWLKALDVVDKAISKHSKHQETQHDATT
jgi:hypothetical protein